MIEKGFDIAAWSHAEDFLLEAMSQDPETSPRAAIHQSYYAMFHAARAVLLRHAGAAPKKHSSVIGQFGRLAKTRGIEFVQASRDLNHLESRRIRADYKGKPEAAEARDALHRATAFVNLCAENFGFPRRSACDNG